MYGMKIAGADQVSFGPVPVLMVVKIIWSTAYMMHRLIDMGVNSFSLLKKVWCQWQFILACFLEETTSAYM